MDKATVRSVRETSHSYSFWKGGFTDGNHTAHTSAYRQGRTVGMEIADILDYVKSPQKTDNGRLINGRQYDSRVAGAEFLLSKRQYAVLTGRTRGEDDVIAYHVRQSFVPGEITPEEANRIGVEFAKRFTKNNHAFIVCTHIDKAHIHNHIIYAPILG